jgi:6-methylsalicylate decarboxylase
MGQHQFAADEQGRVTRRSLMAGAAAATVAGTIAGGRQAAHARAEHGGRGSPRHGRRIDVHSHFVPPEYKQVAERHGQFPGPPWSAEEHIAFMDRWGIEASVVSMGSNFPFGDTDETRDTARAINEAGRRLLDQHPDRFGMHVALPLPDVDGALAELSYGLDTLGLDNGVLLHTNYAGVYLGDDMYTPLYEELDRRGCVAWVHPLSPAASVPVFSGPSRPILEYPFDTTRAAANLIYEDVLERYPNIRWQLSHAGGTLPFLLYRIGEAHTVPFSGIPTDGAPGRVGPFAFARRFYYDLASVDTEGQLVSTKAIADTSRILFGADWPFLSGRFEPDAAQSWPWLADFLPEGDDPAPTLSKAFKPSDRRRIERDNALALYPSVAARLSAV